MATIRFEAELEYDDEMMHGGDADAEAKAWFLDLLVRPDELTLHSEEIGDTLGDVRIVRVLS